MIEVLAAIGGIGTLGLAGVVAFFAIRLVGAKDQQLAVRDLLEVTRDELSAARRDLELETAGHKATRALLVKEQDARAVAEAQRNEAWRDARDHFVEKLKTAKIADANRFIAGLLAEPLPGFVPQAVPEQPRTAEADRDGLLDPFVREPAAGTGAGGVGRGT